MVRMQIYPWTSYNENKTLFATVLLNSFIIMVEHTKTFNLQNFRLNILFCCSYFFVFTLMTLSAAERARRYRRKKVAAGLSNAIKEKDRQRKQGVVNGLGGTIKRMVYQEIMTGKRWKNAADFSI